jgi:hypothetical protein
MAGRHGVPSPERKAHARVARRQRKRRVQRRDAAQPWLLWLLVRFLLTLIVLGAVGWSALLLQRGEGGYWPIIAIAAGALSIVMIALDVLARRRQRAALRVQTVARMREVAQPRRRGAHHADPALPAVDALPHPRAELDRGSVPDQGMRDHGGPDQSFVPEPPPRPGRHSHRR